MSQQWGDPPSPSSSSPGGYDPGGYNPPPGGPMTPQSPPPQGQQPMHPAIPALVSFLLPGVGLFFLKDKSLQQTAIMMIVGTIVGIAVLIGVVTVISIVTMGIGTILYCCFLLLPLWNIAAALYTYDMAAKESNGQFNPIYFK